MVREDLDQMLQNEASDHTQGRRQSKTSILLRNVDQKSIETVFSIAICRPTGDKWQSKTLFLSIFDPRSSIVDYVFDLPPTRCGPGSSLFASRIFYQNLNKVENPTQQPLKL